jgi:hypothetical protein
MIKASGIIGPEAIQSLGWGTKLHLGPNRGGGRDPCCQLVKTGVRER